MLDILNYSLQTPVDWFCGKKLRHFYLDRENWPTKNRTISLSYDGFYKIIKIGLRNCLILLFVLLKFGEVYTMTDNVLVILVHKCLYRVPCPWKRGYRRIFRENWMFHCWDIAEKRIFSIRALANQYMNVFLPLPTNFIAVDFWMLSFDVFQKWHNLNAWWWKKFCCKYCLMFGHKLTGLRRNQSKHQSFR